MLRLYDAIIIGSGQAAPSLARRLAAAGRKTVLIEREHFGGTCLNDGCTPTKALVASARVAYLTRIASLFGVMSVDTSRVVVDMKRVRARKDELIERLVGSLTSSLEAVQGLTLLRGEARFISSDTVCVGAHELSAKQIFINVGGRPAIPHIPGLSDVPYLTSTSMMAVDYLPEHLAIVGGGYIALEFAQMYRRFGSKVTVLEHGHRVVSREDQEISHAIEDILRLESIDIRFNVNGLSVRKDDRSGLMISFVDQGGPALLEASHLLIATGRTLNTDRLGLDAAGIALNPDGSIAVSETLETNVPGIYALGDVNGRGTFTHTAYNDYEIVAGNLLDGKSKRVSDRIATHALYIDPPLGRAGMTERQVLATGRPALIATLPMTKVGRARERSETLGFMKVMVDAETHLILGAALLGIEADEVIQFLLLAMSASLPYTKLTELMGIHPTVTGATAYLVCRP